MQGGIPIQRPCFDPEGVETSVFRLAIVGAISPVVLLLTVLIIYGGHFRLSRHLFCLEKFELNLGLT